MGYSVIRGSSFKKAVPSARSLIKVLRAGEKIIDELMSDDGSSSDGSGDDDESEERKSS